VVDDYNLRRAGLHDLTGDDFEPVLAAAREAAARLIGADADEIALLSNTSFGINLARTSCRCAPASAWW
jgi:selenocysteine lyase/cysteine desulfurase